MSLFDRLSAGLSAAVGAFRGSATVAIAPPETSSRASSKAVRAAVSGRVAGDSPRIDKYPVHLGPAMTPANVSNVLRRAERGYMRAYCELLSELRKTVPQIQTELSKREKALAGCDYTITPAQVSGRRDQARAKKIAETINARVRAIESFSDSIEHLQGGIYYGRSGCENDYFRDRNGIGVRSLVPVLPKRLSYAADWRVHIYDEAGNERDPRLGSWPGVDIRAEWPDKFIVHEPRTLGPEPPTSQGLGYVLVWAGMFWKWSAKHWMQFAELFANPWRVGYYQQNAGEDDIEVLKQGLIDLSGLTTAVFAESCKPMFLQPRDSRTHESLLSVWNSEISKIVNGGTLTTQTSGNSGTRAQGEVHERESAKLTRGDGRAMDATLTRDLIRPLTRLNFGADAAATLCPVFRMVTEEREDIEARASRIWAFVDRGGELDQDVVREETTGLPAPSAKSKLLKPLGATAASIKASAPKLAATPTMPAGDDDTSDATTGEPDTTDTSDDAEADDTEDA